jgi:hypothetical protein
VFWDILWQLVNSHNIWSISSASSGSELTEQGICTTGMGWMVQGKCFIGKFCHILRIHRLIPTRENWSTCRQTCHSATLSTTGASQLAWWCHLFHHHHSNGLTYLTLTWTVQFISLKCMDPEDCGSKFLRTFSAVNSSVMLWLSTSLIMLLCMKLYTFVYLITVGCHFLSARVWCV